MRGNRLTITPEDAEVILERMETPGEISPEFIRYNRRDARIIERVCLHWMTPKAIVQFDKRCAGLTDYGYWYMLGTLWVGYTGFSELTLWRRLFRSSRPKRSECLMKPYELEALVALPDPLTIYRAHRPAEVDWIAYTTSPVVAERFKANRPGAVIRTYTVAKRDVLCLFLRRDESEVLVLDRQAVREVS